MRDNRAGARLLLPAGALVFCALAIANSAGYRYGVSDLAFYLPAAFQRLEPALFPRDRQILDVQARLTLADEGIAHALAAGRAVGVGDQATIYALHIATLLALFGAAVAFGRAVFRSPWATAAFVTAMTLRHAVARTGVNTLEGYFHPRVLAFAIGLLAFAVFLRRGPWPALALGLVAAAVHTTTAFWFLIALGVAGLVSERRQRIPLLAIGIAAAGMLAYAIGRGPLAGRLQPMDAGWLAVVAEKDYLFPDRWGAGDWLTCVLYVAVWGSAAFARWREGELRGRERGLVAGSAALLGIFLLMLPPLLVRSALAVQLQPSRVFWIFDALATAAVVRVVAERPRRRATRSAVALTAVLLLFSTGRGIYLLAVRFPERSLAQLSQPRNDWEDAMRFARTTDVGSYWLAHPDHTFLYGSGVRVSGHRDVLVERTKDPAVAMYDRGVAMRVADRLASIGEFDAMTAPRARELAGMYEIDYLITEAELPLPVAFQNGTFRVYRLR
jgi:hypothetical protein